MTKLGLIAGGGAFPLLIAAEARTRGREVFAVGFEGETSEALEQSVNKMLWLKLGELGKLTQFFKHESVNEAVMAGHIRKPRILSGSVLPDWSMIQLLSHVKGWTDENLLGAMADHLDKNGVHLMDSTALLGEALAEEGVLTRRSPSKKEWAEIAFGFETAKRIAGMDIGQAVAVKDQSVVAVESIEGTDAMIRRAGLLVNRGVAVVKVARPRQDMRFDVPAVGLDTVRTLIDANVDVLAVEAQKTFFFQKSSALQLANENRICIVGVTNDVLSNHHAAVEK